MAAAVPHVVACRGCEASPARAPTAWRFNTCNACALAPFGYPWMQVLAAVKRRLVRLRGGRCMIHHAMVPSRQRALPHPQQCATLLPELHGLGHPDRRPVCPRGLGTWRSYARHSCRCAALGCCPASSSRSCCAGSVRSCMLCQLMRIMCLCVTYAASTAMHVVLKCPVVGAASWV